MVRRGLVSLFSVLVALCVVLRAGCSQAADVASSEGEAASAVETPEEQVSSEEDAQTRAVPSGAASRGGDMWLPEDGSYISKDEVAWYLHTYGHLPKNFVTKKEAQAAGWKTKGLSLGEACPGCSIGGDRFGNYEGLLPKAKGRTWWECDIDTHGKSRGPKRIVFSSDGLIYYTDDHYESFVRLY